MEKSNKKDNEEIDFAIGDWPNFIRYSSAICGIESHGNVRIYKGFIVISGVNSSCVLVVTEDDKYSKIKYDLCMQIGSEYVVLPKTLPRIDQISTSTIINNISGKKSEILNNISGSSFTTPSKIK